MEIGDWVLREACAQVRRWRDADDLVLAGRGQRVRGAVPRRQPGAPGGATPSTAAGIDSRMIELEFTEGALIEYSSAVSKAVKVAEGRSASPRRWTTSARATARCRTCGTFPIDTLKIDRVFVRDIASKSAGNAPLVDAIIAMAKSLGLATVAEGVETEAQWQYLKDRDANQVQGFLFCRPLSVADLERWHTDWLHSPISCATQVRLESRAGRPVRLHRRAARAPRCPVPRAPARARSRTTDPTAGSDI